MIYYQVNYSERLRTVALMLGFKQKKRLPTFLQDQIAAGEVQ
jgi:hypothetical protein